jgi:hypothetical protein
MRLFILLGFLLAATAMAGAAPAEPNPAPALPPAPDASASASFKSVFVNDASSGKDPFFPRSVRRPLVKVGPASTVVFVDFPEDIQLKGIAIQRGRRLALLNHYTFVEGEENEMKIAEGPVRVHCLSIKERSVIVSVRGIRKELQLREGL